LSKYDDGLAIIGPLTTGAAVGLSLAIAYIVLHILICHYLISFQKKINRTTMGPKIIVACIQFIPEAYTSKRPTTMVIKAK
jgi:hypothetical protein